MASLTSIFKTASVALAATALFVCHSHADSYYVEDTITSTKTDWNKGLNLAKFDGSLGTLDSVTLTLSTGATTTITITNNAASGSNGTARTEVNFTLSGNSASSLGLPDGTNPEVGYLLTLQVPTNTTYTLDPGASVVKGPFSKNGGTGDMVYTDSITLANFTGLGNLDLNLETFTQTVLANNGGNTSADQSTTASSTVRVTYNYTAVPEPATWAAIAMGAGLLIASARFRRKI